jgi:hypothetical protein
VTNSAEAVGSAVGLHKGQTNQATPDSDRVGNQDRSDRRSGFQKVFEELPGGPTVSLFYELGNGELTRAVDGHEEKELALRRPHLGDVDVEEADGIAPEPGPLRSVALDVGQTGDAMTLKAAV